MIDKRILANRIQTFLDRGWLEHKAEKFAMDGWYYEKDNNSVHCWKCKAKHRGSPNEDLPQHKPGCEIRQQTNTGTTSQNTGTTSQSPGTTSQNTRTTPQSPGMTSQPKSKTCEGDTEVTPVTQSERQPPGSLRTTDVSTPERAERRSRSGSEVTKQNSGDSGYQSTGQTPEEGVFQRPGWTPTSSGDTVLPSLVETPTSSVQAGSNLPGEPPTTTGETTTTPQDNRLLPLPDTRAEPGEGGSHLPSETPITQPPAETSTTTENPAVKPPAETRTGPGESSSKARGRSPSSPAERGFKDSGEATTEVKGSKASPKTPAEGGSQSRGWSGLEPGRPPDHRPSNTTGPGDPSRPVSGAEPGGPLDPPPSNTTGPGDPRRQVSGVKPGELTSPHLAEPGYPCRLGSWLGSGGQVSGAEPVGPPDPPPSNIAGAGGPCRPGSWLDSGGQSDPALRTGSGEPRSQAPAAPSDTDRAGLSQAPSGSGSDAAPVSLLRTGRRPALQRQVSIDGTRGRAVRIVSGSFSEFPHDPEQDLGQDPDQDPVQNPEHDLDQDSEDDLYQYSEGEDDVFLDNQVERHVVGEQRHPEDTYGGLEEGVEEAVDGVDPTQSPPPQTPREGQPLYWEGLPSDSMENVDGMAPLGEPLPSVSEGGSVLFPTDERDDRTDKGSQVRQPEERQCYVCKCDIIPGQQVERCTTQQCRNAWHPPCANETLTPTITTPQLAPAGAARGAVVGPAAAGAARGAARGAAGAARGAVVGPAAAGAAGGAPRRCHDCKIRTRTCRPCAWEEVATPGRLTEWVECEGCRAAYHDTCLEEEFQSRRKTLKVYDNGCEDIVAKIVPTCPNCRDFDERVDSE